MSSKFPPPKKDEFKKKLTLGSISFYPSPSEAPGSSEGDSLEALKSLNEAAKKGVFDNSENDNESSE